MPTRALPLLLAPPLALLLAAAPATRPTTTQAASRPATSRVAASAAPPVAAPPRTAATTRATTRRAALGEPFPPFRMTRVDGKLATNESLMGKPTVILFGSWSAPSFRDQVPRVADLATRYGGRVNWLVVYTRELFPTGDGNAGPHRNGEEQIVAPAATTDAECLAAAKRLVERLKLSRLEVAPDAIDDRLTNAADAFPNAAFVLDARGTIVARLEWAEPFAMKRHLDALLARK